MSSVHATTAFTKVAISIFVVVIRAPPIFFVARRFWLQSDVFADQQWSQKVCYIAQLRVTSN